MPNWPALVGILAGSSAGYLLGQLILMHEDRTRRRRHNPRHRQL